MESIYHPENIILAYHSFVLAVQEQNNALNLPSFVIRLPNSEIL